MHRAGKRSVAALALLGTVAATPSAWAFHAGPTFDKPPGAGGTDGIYYTGSPLEHGWKCDLCHQNPAGQIKVTFQVSPPELFKSFTYTPGATYTFTAQMVGEHLGLTSPKSNYNSLAVQILDTNQAPVGAMLYAPVDFYSGFSPTTIVSAGTTPNVTSWTFKWIAPGPTDGVDAGPPGAVTMYVAAVDGNGADSGANATLTDPFNDDFFSAEIQLTEGKVKMGGRTPPRPGTLVCMLGLAVMGIAQRQRRRR